MNYCPKCGLKLPDNAAFCPSCGYNVDSTGNSGEYSYQRDVTDNKVFAIMAYIGILVLVPIFAAKESKFAQYHANQGLCVCILWVADMVVFSILRALSWIAFPWVMGTIVSILSSIVSVLIAVLVILGIINAARGEQKELPVVGSWKILKQ